MSERTGIEWTNATYNPWRGCDKVSPGCAHCYMFTEQRRYGRDPSVVVRCSPATFNAPIKKREWLDLAPGSLVFTCSWSDWFHEKADAWRDEAWEVIRQRPDLTWQILTKRPERIAGHLPSWWGDADCEAPDNIWLGVSIENRRFVSRADVLREVPAAVRFISAEPLLGPLMFDVAEGPGPEDYWPYDQTDHYWSDGVELPELDLTDINWLIVGGESGPGHRRMDLQWARDLRDACSDSGTAFFLKQLGGAHSGTDLHRLPADLRIREFPTAGSFA